MFAESRECENGGSAVDDCAGEQTPDKHCHPETGKLVTEELRNICEVLPHLVEELKTDVPPQGEHRPNGKF